METLVKSYTGKLCNVIFYQKMLDSHNDLRMDKQSQNNWQCSVRNTSLPFLFYNVSILDKSVGNLLF